MCKSTITFSTWISNRHHKINTAKIELIIDSWNKHSLTRILSQWMPPSSTHLFKPNFLPNIPHSTHQWVVSALPPKHRNNSVTSLYFNYYHAVLNVISCLLIMSSLTSCFHCISVSHIFYVTQKQQDQVRLLFA